MLCTQHEEKSQLHGQAHLVFPDTQAKTQKNKRAIFFHAQSQTNFYKQYFEIYLQNKLI